VDRQREDCQRLIEQRGWQLVEEFVDNDISASGRKRRPGFDALMTAVEDGRLDTIVSLSMDRLTRNKRDELRIHDVCMPRQVLIALVKGSDIDTGTAAGRLVMDLLGSVARHEIEVKSERHRRQVQQAAAAGKPGGGPRAFGYRKGGLEVDQAEGGVVVELYARFLAGAGLGELADFLNRDGWKTPKGLKWKPGSVKAVLANPRNAGIRGIRRIEDEATGRRSRWHEVVGKAQWPGLVPEETWRAAVVKLQDKTRPGMRKHLGPIPRYLLTGIALCGRCGAHMITSSSGGGATGPDSRYRTYECSSKQHISRRAIPIEKFVEMSVVDRLRESDAIDLLTPPDPSVNLEALRSEALSMREHLRNIMIAYNEHVIDLDQMRIGSQDARARLAAIETQIAAAGQVDVLAPLVLAEDWDATHEVWKSYPMSSQRAVVRRLMRIVVKRGKVGRPASGFNFDPRSVEITYLGAAVEADGG
jgi:DNA invertase Pin-like site-specific DNA recombinase